MSELLQGLAENHLELIRASGISAKVAAARGYRTVTVKADLRRLGFSETQSRVPALLIPIRNVHGEIASYQIRPNEPRINRDGKRIKYETPGGARMLIDVPSGILDRLTDPSMPLFITEGARKADAAVTQGLVCISLQGVWSWRGTNEQGGKTALADWELIALNNRKVYIAFDSDVVEKPQVQQAMFRLKTFLESRGASVRVIRLPSGEGGKKVGLDDFFAEGKSVDDLLALVGTDSSSGEQANAIHRGEQDEPIYAGQADLNETLAFAWDAITRRNVPPKLFLYGNADVTRVGAGQYGEPMIVSVGPDGMRLAMARSSKWYLADRSGERTDAKPPSDVARAMLADELCPLPRLDRIIRAPIIGRDGELILGEGYHPGTRVYYFRGQLDVPDVSLNPTPEEIESARELILNDVLIDFPFVLDADRANAVALFLLPFVRELIDGPTPIHLIEKPTPGTGAGLLIDVIALSTRGGNCPLMTEGSDEDEWRKRITSALMNSPEILTIDNLRRRLDSAALSAAVTARTWSDRKLGQSLVVSLPVRCAWVATGNNPAVSSEIARRCVSIRMDAKVDRPWHRPTEKFKHPELRLWAAENRGKLIWAALTWARAWFSAGCPKANLTLGGFEEWAKIMGGILEVAGIKGFLDNHRRFYDRADREGEVWRSLVSAWWGRFGGEEVGTKDLFDLINEVEIPFELGKGSERSQKTRFGSELAKNVDRLFTINDISLKLEGAGTYQGAARWRLVNLVNPVNVSDRDRDESKDEGVSLAAEKAPAESLKGSQGSPEASTPTSTHDHTTPLGSDFGGDPGGKGSLGPQGSPNPPKDDQDDAVRTSGPESDREVGEI